LIPQCVIDLQHFVNTKSSREAGLSAVFAPSTLPHCVEFHAVPLQDGRSFGTDRDVCFTLLAHTSHQSLCEHGIDCA
jgi:hypothetical protein